MKWIIFSNDPAKLSALLESAKSFLPNTIPDVMLMSQPNRDVAEIYADVDYKFSFRAKFTVNFHQELLDAIPGQDGLLEQLVLFTPDNILFTRRVDLRDIHIAIKDQNVLGVDLTRHPGNVNEPLRNGRFIHGESRYYTWDWTNPFAFGAIYRTSDLLGPLHRNEWDSPKTLLSAINEDASLCRRSRMACLSEASLTQGE